MKADINPTDIAIVLLVELLFGILYNWLVAYLNKHRLMHVSIEVALGVAIALLIPILVWYSYWMLFLIFFLCFVACGTPMIIGSMSRTVKDQKKRKLIVGTSARIRDEAVMEVNTIIYDVTDKAEKKELEVSDYVVLVGKLHALIGMLKSL